MNAEGLLAHYARIADAPDAITRLRRFVLDLAVRGKLIVQSPDDEPATKLLERLLIEKARCIKEGTAKPARVLPVVDEDVEFDIPSTWTWTRLGVIAGYVQRGKSPIYAEQQGLPVVSQKCIQWSGLDLTAAKNITNESLSRYEDIRFLRDGDLLWNSTGTGTIGRVINLVSSPKQLVCDSHVTVVRCLMVLPEYVRIWLCSDHVYGRIESKASGSTNQVELTAQMAINQVVPLPPLSEQQRIVAKVDELMALCDQLEAARAQREATRDRLAAASLARLNTPDPDAFSADARFALDALPALTSRPDQIKQLRQTILNLAVRGKLVPQEPSNEPATSLLKKIALLRSKKLEGGYPNEAEARAQLKKSRAQRVPDQLEPLPIGWTWATLMQCSILVVDCKNKTAPYAKSGIRLIRTTNVRDGQMNSIDQKYVDQRTYEEWSIRCAPEPGDVLITREAPMGEVCLIPPGETICLGQRMMLARLPDDLMDPRFVIYSLQDPRLMDRVQDKPIGATVQHLRVGGVETLLMPVPPLEEQHRIVAKLDELMTLCDQLEASLTTGEAARSQLLDALLHEALAPAAAASSKHPRAAVSGYVVSRLASKRNFGRTAHMKHLYLAESRLGLKLGGRYMRQAAGPLDTGIYALEKQAEAADWYTHCVETLPSGKEKVSYVPGKALKALAEEGVAVLGPLREEMDRLIDLMGGLTTEQVEIIATLFAAWNDALLDGHTPDDNWIVKEVREHWHASKQRFAPAELQKWLGWMRQNDVIPLGHPPRTMQQTTMEF